ncbi:ribonuclease H-like domain-containing protein [Tanacetum coccineum]
MVGEDAKNPPPPPPVVTPTQQAPHTMSTIKFSILKKGEYDIWAMKMEHYLAHTDDLIWEVIQRGNGHIWDAIKSRFGGNDESKKMQKYILKQQFECFSMSPIKMPIRSSLGLYLHPGPNTACGASTSSGYNSQRENSSSYTDEIINGLEMAGGMISMRLKKFYKKIGRKLQFDAKEPVGFDKTKVGCFNCHKTGHFARECRSKGYQDEEPKALVTLDGDGIDWTAHTEDEQENFALMAYSNSGSDTKVEAQLVAHQKNQLWYEEKIRFIKIDLDDKTDVLTYHKKLLAEAVKEKEELKTRLEKWQNSSKGLNKLLYSHMSVKDKIGLGFREQVKENELYDEALISVFDSHSSDIKDAHVYDRFAKDKRMHAVPPPMTGNYILDGHGFRASWEAIGCLWVFKFSQEA